MIRRRVIGYAIALAVAGVGIAVPASAQSDYPTRAVKMVWPYAAGGVGDIVARLMAEKTSAALGQQIVVENQTGAGGAIGVQAAAQAEPDGYTFLQISAGLAVLPAVQTVPYDLTNDFIPIYGVGTVPYVFAVNASSDINSLDDLKARAESNGIIYGSGSRGSVSHLGSARLAGILAMDAVHVPYSGFAGAVQALMSNEVDYVAVTYIDVAQLVAAGSVRILAVTGESRLSELPDVPTMTELGYDLTMATWYAYLAPAGTPEPIVQKLHDALAATAQDPEVVTRLKEIGIIVAPIDGAQVAEQIKAEEAGWRQAIADYKINLEN
ncbi:Bug family tripartite tricarboxylate transporter substrate binding protein [Devosia sp. A369]